MERKSDNLCIHGQLQVKLKFFKKFNELKKYFHFSPTVNTKSQILITDSRNHRIQLFSIDGHFISRFSFDGMNHSRYLKGLTTPRGCAFTPEGNIIISDFENHRLILLDAAMTKVNELKNILSLYFKKSNFGKILFIYFFNRYLRQKDTRDQHCMNFAVHLEFVSMMMEELLLLTRRIKEF